MAVWFLGLALVRGEVLGEAATGMRGVAGRGGDAVVLDAHVQTRTGMAERGMRSETSEQSAMGKQLRADGNCLTNSDICVCTCAKCGSTSLYSMIYQGVLGKKWVNCNQVHGRARAGEAAKDERTDNAESCDIYGSDDSGDPKMAEWLAEWQPGWHPKEETFSFAVVRDPVKRLMSTYRSKFACESQNFKTDWSDRTFMMPKLLAAAQIKDWESKKCLTADEYVKALYEAYQKGSLDFNDHLKPQTENCFQEGREYTLVCELGDEACFQKLQAKLPHPAEFPHTHESMWPKTPKYWANHPEEAKRRFSEENTKDPDELLFNGLLKDNQWKILEITKDEFQRVKGHLHKSRIGRT